MKSKNFRMMQRCLCCFLFSLQRITVTIKSIIIGWQL
jgi:hypothetical protein